MEGDALIRNALLVGFAVFFGVLAYVAVRALVEARAHAAVEPDGLEATLGFGLREPLDAIALAVADLTLPGATKLEIRVTPLAPEGSATTYRWTLRCEPIGALRADSSPRMHEAIGMLASHFEKLGGVPAGVVTVKLEGGAVASVGFAIT